MKLRAVLGMMGMGLALASAGCGKETGRLPFTADGTHSGTFDLKAGDAALWTELDMEWDGDAILQYKVEMLQNGNTVASVTCDPLGNLPMKTSWVSTDLGNHHSRRGNGKMTCDAKVPAAGLVAVTASLVFVKTPAKFSLKKADLVVKQ